MSFYIFSDILVLTMQTSQSLSIKHIFPLDLIVLQHLPNNSLGLAQILSSPPSILEEIDTPSNSNNVHHIFQLDFHSPELALSFTQSLTGAINALLKSKAKELGFQTKDLKTGWKHIITRGTQWSAALFGDSSLLFPPFTSDCDGLHPLHLACYSGHLDIVKDLAQQCKEFPIDHRGNTCMHIAVNQAHPDIVEYLCVHQPELISMTNNDAQTPLMVGMTKRAESSRRGRLCIESLIQHNAELDYTVPSVQPRESQSLRNSFPKRPNVSRRSSAVHSQPGFGAIHICCTQNYENLCKLLLIGGASPSLVIRPARISALSLALELGHLSIVEVLLKFGACPNLKDTVGRPPLYFANCIQAARLLISYGARPEVMTDRFAEVEETRALKLARSEYLTQHSGDVVQGESVADPKQWIDDSLSSVCRQCSSKFSFLKRKHHCRRCGELVCGECSQHEFFATSAVPALGSHSETVTLRCCDSCFNFLKYSKEFEFGAIVDGAQTPPQQHEPVSESIDKESVLQHSISELQEKLDNALETIASLKQGKETQQNEYDELDRLRDRLEQVESASATKDVVIRGLLDELENSTVISEKPLNSHNEEIQSYIQSLLDEIQSLKVELSDLQREMEDDAEKDAIDEMDRKTQSMHLSLAKGKRISKRMGTAALISKTPNEMQKRISDLEFQVYYGQTKKDDTIRQLNATIKQLQEQLETNAQISERQLNSLEDKLRIHDRDTLEQWIFDSPTFAF